MYAQDYDEVLPRMQGWDEALRPYYRSDAILHCPLDEQVSVPSYAMNPSVAGQVLGALDKTTVMFYEGSGMVVAERHDGGAHYAFVDGHVKRYGDPPEGFGAVVERER